MRSPLRAALVTAGLSLAALSGTSLSTHANGSGVLGFSHRETGRVNYVTAGTTNFVSGVAQLQVAGIPPGATVRKAFLYATQIWVRPSRTPIDGFAFGPNQTSFPLQTIGQVSAGTFRTDTFRVDLTNVIAGNGSYSMELLASQASFPPMATYSLLVIYEDSSLPADFQIEVVDGIHMGPTNGPNGAWPSSSAARFTGFTVNGSVTPEVEVSYLTATDADIDLNLGQAVAIVGYRFGATQAGLASTLATDTRYTRPTPSKRSAWNRFDVSSRFSGGETEAWAHCAEGSNHNDFWTVGVLRVRTSSPQPPDVTPPTLALASPADGDVVGASPVTVEVCVRDESGATLSSTPALTWSPSHLDAPAMGESTATMPLVEGPNALLVRAVDDYGNPAERTLTVVLDTISPAVQIDSPADGAFLATSVVEVLGSVTDATSAQVSSSPPGITATLPGGSPSRAFSGQLALIEGENLITLSAEDQAGNHGVAAALVTVDTIAPQVYVRSPVQGAAVGLSPITIAADVVDATATTVRIGSSTLAVAAGGGPALASLALVPGWNEIPVTVTDAAGNETSTSVAVVLDLDAPLVAILAPQEGDSFGPGESSVVLIASVQDLTATTVSSTPAGISAAVPASGGLVSGELALSEGSNTLTVAATDATGKWTSASVRVVLDTTAPLAAIVAPHGDTPVRGVIDFHATAADAAPGSGVARVEFAVDGTVLDSQTQAPYGLALDTTALADGSHLLEATAYDGEGNAGSASLWIVVDNTAPVIDVISPSNGAYVAGEMTIGLSASDAGVGLGSLVLSTGGNVRFAESFVPPQGARSLAVTEDTLLHADGPLVVVARVVDAAGNSAEASVSVTVDNTAPQKTLISPLDGSRVSGLISIAAAAEDANLASIELRVNGVSLGSSPSSPFAVPFDTTARLDGDLLVEAIVTDQAGNTGTCSATVVVDNLSVRVDPASLNLRSRGKENSVTVTVEGVNAALLLSAQAGPIALRVPGGGSVPATSHPTALTDADRDGVPELVLKFDRQALIASLQAGIAVGSVVNGSNVPLMLTAGAQASAIGSDLVRVKD